MKREYFIACAGGFEPVVAGELRGLGAEEIQPRTGGVACQGPTSLRYRANLWLRAAIRVLEPVLHADDVTTPEALYDALRTVDWSHHLTVRQKLSIDAVVRDSAMRHSGFAALKAKDAIVDQFRERRGLRPDAGRDGADLPLQLHLSRNRLTISRDTSGGTLHKRGYRPIQVKSPLNEALAAGILLHSGWDRTVPLADPMCGSGTFAIEAALLAAEMAPGLLRHSWPFQSWPDFDPAEWRRLRTEARDRAKKTAGVPIFASDHHAGALDLARKSARAAGVEAMIRFSVADISDFSADPPPGLFILNPPYGERLKDDDLPGLYRKIGTTLRRFPGATAWILSGNREMTHHLGFKASSRLDFRNGDLSCRLLRYEIFPPRTAREIAEPNP